MIHFFPFLKIMLLEVDVLNFIKFFFVTYWKNYLPFAVAVIKHAQYLDPEKQNLPGSLSVLSNLSLKVTTILMKCQSSVFEVSSSTSFEILRFLLQLYVKYR